MFYSKPSSGLFNVHLPWLNAIAATTHNYLIIMLPLLLMLTNRDISLIRRGRLYSSRVLSSMLHGSETWPVRKDNEVALQRAEMRMVRWMCNVKVKDRVQSKELRERLGIHDIILIL